MNESNGLTASDVALLTGNNNDSFGNGGWGGMIWLFAILALMGGGFGGGWAVMVIILNMLPKISYKMDSTSMTYKTRIVIL